MSQIEMNYYRYSIVVGCSQGLGAAMVEELLKIESTRVIGIARRGLEEVETLTSFSASGRYSHVKLDITSSNCRKVLMSVASEIPHEPLCIYFNAAHVANDVRGDGTIDFAVFDNINTLGIGGLGNVIEAFEGHLLKYGGDLVGISSFSALVPPVNEPRVAYPASKAYLDMLLRCLSAVWGNKVR